MIHLEQGTGLIAGSAQYGDSRTQWVTWHGNGQFTGTGTLLRDTPEPAGQAFWITSLNNGLSPADALNAFITSPEYILRF